MKFSILVLAALLCVIAASATYSEDAKPPELVAVRAEQALPLQTMPGDAWKAAPEFRILARAGHIGDTWVTMRAMYDDEHFYLHASWADKTESHVRGTWQFGEDDWQRQAGDEDRLAIAFNISSEKFNREGCDGFCHDDKLYAPEENAKIDLWHWKAARGGRFMNSDDQVLVYDKEGGRVNDAGRTVAGDNVNAEKTGPARRWKDDADKGGPLNADTSVLIDAAFKPKIGYSVPYVLHRPGEGSRADIESRGEWKDGRWHVMFKRKLNTSHNDDAQFKPGGRVSFGLSVFDNTGAKVGNEHAKSAVAWMTIKE